MTFAKALPRNTGVVELRRRWCERRRFCTAEMGTRCRDGRSSLHPRSGGCRRATPLSVPRMPTAVDAGERRQTTRNAPYPAISATLRDLAKTTACSLPPDCVPRLHAPFRGRHLGILFRPADL